MPEQSKGKSAGKQKRAVALGYDPQHGAAPEVIAKGRGKTAQRIIDTANQHKIPLYEDVLLAEALENVEIGQNVPENIYNVVAQVFAFIYMIDKESGKSIKKNNNIR